MYLYHYCVTYTTPSGQYYTGGFIETGKKISNGQEYGSIRRELIDKNDWPDSLVIVSLNLLS